MRRKKKDGDKLTEFIRKITKEGLTYREAQIMETCQLIKEGKIENGRTLFGDPT